MKNENSFFISSDDDEDEHNPSTRDKEPVICSATSRIDAKDRVELKKSDFLRIEALKNQKLATVFLIISAPLQFKTFLYFYQKINLMAMTAVLLLVFNICC
jgi:hypothetical protein